VNCKDVNRLFVWGLSLYFCSTAFAASEEQLDPSRIIFVLRQSKVIKREQTLTAVINQRQADILTERKDKETDDDCKIDAVLIAKEIINSFPDQINRVRITFQKPGDSQASQVDVTAGDVKAYAMGAMKPDALLGSLEMQQVDYRGGTGQAMTVVNGPLLDKRLALLGRIEGLKAKGTSVKPFRDLFDNIENETSQHAMEEKISKDIAYLDEHLTEQESLVKQSRQPSNIAKGTASGSTPVASVDLKDFYNRCDAMRAKFEGWERQGRDVTQLKLSVMLIRSMATDPDPTKRVMAGPALDAIEHTMTNPPH